MTSVSSHIPSQYSFLTGFKVTFFDDLCTHLRMRKLQTLPLLHYVIVREAGWPAMRYNYVYYLRVESTEAYGVLVAMER